MTHGKEYTHDPDDIRQGIDWWNGLSEDERLSWLNLAALHDPGLNPPRPVDAWTRYKAEGRGHE